MESASRQEEVTFLRENLPHGKGCWEGCRGLRPKGHRREEADGSRWGRWTAKTALSWTACLWPRPGSSGTGRR